MSTNFILAVCLIGIIVSIIAGWKFNVNTGIVAMCFALIIGCFLMKISVTNVLKMFPGNIVYFILIVSVFYGYAAQNGTLKKLSSIVLYALKGKAWLVPWVLFICSALMSFLGAGSGATIACLAPIGFTMAAASGQNPVLYGMGICLASMCGSDNPINGISGVIMKGLLENLGYGFDIAIRVWASALLKHIGIFAILYIIFRGYKGKNVTVEKPESLDKDQKKTLVLILLAIVLVVIPKLLAVYVPTTFTKYVGKYMEPQLVITFMALVAAVMRLGDEKAIMKSLPMNAVFMMSGVYILMSVATQAGLTNFIAQLIGGNVPTWLVAACFVLAAGFLSFFTGGITVVCPLLFPMVPSIATATGLNPIMLFSAIFVGAMSTSTSPFSAAGATLLGCVRTEEDRNKMFFGTITSSLLVWGIVVIFAAIGGFNVFA